jgi:hypothetical protein
VLVLAGGLILRPGSSSDDSSSATADTAAEAPAAAVAPQDGSTLRSESNLEQATAAAGAAPDDSTPTEFGSDVGTDTGDEAPPPDDEGLELLTSPDDLAIFASDALDAPSAAELPDDATVTTDAGVDTAPGGSLDTTGTAVTLPLCRGADRVVGLASYKGETVVVGIDDGQSMAFAYRAADCSEVARVLLR